jgi:hypothetical protein
MAFMIQWLVENRILLIKITGTFTVEEAVKISQRTIELSRQIPTSPPTLLHSIVDMVDMAKGPALREYTRIRNDVKSPHNSGWLVFVNDPHSVIRFATNVAAQFFGVRFQFTDNIPDALNLLQVYDDSLPDLSKLVNEYSSEAKVSREDSLLFHH